jgi:CheY-like chemotaxis protein
VRTVISTIYLIDDEEDSHFVTKLVLRKAGFTGRLSCFTTAAEGFAALRDAHEPPDLILIDINMPVMGGFDLVRQCEQHGLLPNGHTTVLMFSSSNRPQDLEAARSLTSVEGYVEKVLTVDRFREILEARSRRA